MTGQGTRRQHGSFVAGARSLRRPDEASGGSMVRLLPVLARSLRRLNDAYAGSMVRLLPELVHLDDRTRHTGQHGSFVAGARSLRRPDETSGGSMVRLLPVLVHLDD